MSYLVVVFALIVLVLFHELGHFLAARAVGIRATKFYVFFPPALLKRKIGEVEYGLGAIPAGGFVKLPGMFEPEAGMVSQRIGWDTEALGPLLDEQARLHLQAERRRIANAGSADELAAPLGEIERELRRVRDTLEDPADRRRVERVRTRMSDLLDDVHPKAYWRAALWRRMTVIAAGPLVNLVLAFLVLVTFYLWFVPDVRIDGALRVDEVLAGSPAKAAGIDDDSRITEYNGRVDGVSPRELAERIRDGRGEPVELTWRDGKSGPVRTRTIEPEEIEGQELIGLSGIQIEGIRQEGRLSQPLGAAASQTVDEIWAVTWGNLSRLPRVFFDREVREQVGSVVGIVETAEAVDRAGQTIRYIGVISLILAVMNVLPLLPLDGGHLLFGLIEAVRRKPVPRAGFERYSMVGIALVLLLFFIGLDNDIGRIAG